MWVLLGQVPAISTWERIANTFGVPLATMLVLGYAIYRAAGWAAPRVDGLLANHYAHLDKLGHTQEAIIESVRSHDVAEQPKLDRLISTSDSIHDKAGDILSGVTRLMDRQGMEQK